MSEKIQSSDIIEQNIFENTIKSAQKLEEQLKSLNAEYVTTAKATQEILKSSKFSDTKSINEFLKASEQANKMLREQVAIEKDLAKVVNIRTETEAKANLLNAKTKTEEAKANAISSREQERKTKATERETKANTALSSAYARVNGFLGKLRSEYRDLAIKKELGAQLTAKEEFRYSVLEKRINTYDSALKKVDVSMGNHQRNVGNYASGWNGLSNSVNQLTREFPAFANSVQTGFMAISNNLPMFFDELQKIKKANVDLKSQGLETKSALSQLGASIFSWGTALSLGVTLLTLYGAKIIDWVSNALNPANKELEEMNKKQKRIAKEQKEHGEYISKETSLYISLLYALRQTNNGSKERAELIKTMNNDYGTTLKNIKDEAAFQMQVNTAMREYILLKDYEFDRKKKLERFEIVQEKAYKAQQNLIKLNKDLIDVNKQIDEQEILRRTNFGKYRYEDEANLRVKQTQILESIRNNEEVLDYTERRKMVLSKQNLELDQQINEIRKNGLVPQEKTNTNNEKQISTQKDLNLHTSKYLEIVAKLIELHEKGRVLKNETDLESEVQKQLDNISQVGDGELKEIERLLEESGKLRQEAREKEYVANENARKSEFESKKKDLEKDMNALDKKDKKFLDKKKQYEEAIKSLEKDYNIQGAVNKLANEQEKTSITESEMKKRNNIMQQLDAEWTKYYDAEEDKKTQKEEEKLDRIKTTAEAVNNIIQKSLEYYVRLAERRMDILDKRMQRMSTQADFLRDKAVAGNIQAQESLAVIDKQQIEGEKQRINEQRSIQRLQMAMAVFQAYSNNIQNAKVGENPFTKTLTDITLLNQFVASLPTFIDGTETNIAESLGKAHMQGQDGYIVRVDGSEKVLNPKLSAMTGNMTTYEIAKLAEDFRRGEVMRKGEGAMQLNVGSWGTDMIVSELQDLKNVIKNKPENQVEVAEILNGVMHIVETKKSGNTKVRNISRFS